MSKINIQQKSRVLDIHRGSNIHIVSDNDKRTFVYFMFNIFKPLYLRLGLIELNKMVL